MAGDLETVQDELTRRHRAAVMFIVYVFALLVLLVLLAFARLFDIDGSGSMAGALRIVIAVFGLGAVVMRRTMFSVMRVIAYLEHAGWIPTRESLADETLVRERLRGLGTA